MARSLLSAHPDAAPSIAAQRPRVLDAITRVVAERGYAQATVTDVVRAARISRGTFYALFASKDECFLEAYRLGNEVLHERIDRALAQGTRRPSRRAQLEAGLGAWLRELAAEPLFARAALFEVHSAGAAAQGARDEALRGFAARYGATAGRRRPSAEVLFVLAAGIEQLVAAHVRAHGFDDLEQRLLPTLTDTALTVLGGS